MAARRYWRILLLTNFNSFLQLREVELRESVGGADQTGSGTADSNSEFSSSFDAAKAFDDNAGTYYSSSSRSTDTVPAWVSYDFGVGVTKDIVEIQLTAHSSTNAPPGEIMIQSSDDNTNWIDEAYYKDIDWTSSGENKTFSVDNTTLDTTVHGSHRYWRINATTLSDELGYAEIEWRTSVDSGDLTGSGTESASTEDASHLVDDAFDGSASTYWASTGSSSEWVSYDFGSAVRPEYLYLLSPPAAGATDGAQDFTIQYSDNGSSWTNATSFSQAKALPTSRLPFFHRIQPPEVESTPLQSGPQEIDVVII